jgi:hypothetical protein
MSVTSSFAATVEYLDRSASDGYGSSSVAFGPSSFSASYQAGTGAGQVDRAWYELRTLTDDSMTYTLSALPDGQSLGHGRRLLAWIVDPLGTAGSATIGPGAINGWTNGLGGPIPLTPGSGHVFNWADAGAPAVAASANDRITITVVGTLRYLIEVEGTST